MIQVVAQGQVAQFAAADGVQQPGCRRLPFAAFPVTLAQQHAQRYIQSQRMVADADHEVEGPLVSRLVLARLPTQAQFTERDSLRFGQATYRHDASTQPPGDLRAARGEEQMRAGRQRLLERLDGRQRPDIVQHHQQVRVRGEEGAHRVWLEGELSPHVVSLLEKVGGVAYPAAQHRLRLRRRREVGAERFPDHPIGIDGVQFMGQEIGQHGLADAGHALHCHRRSPVRGLPGDGDAAARCQFLAKQIHFMGALHGIAAQCRRRRPAPAALHRLDKDVVDDCSAAAPFSDSRL